MRLRRQSSAGERETRCIFLQSYAYACLLTYRRDVSIVVPFVAVAMHDTSLADVRVAQHQDLVRRCEIQRHVCRGSRAVLNCCWVDNRVVGRGLFFADGREMGDEGSIRGLRFSPPTARVEGVLTIACDFSSLMRDF